MTDSEFNPDWALKLKPDNIPEWIKPAPRWVLWRAETKPYGKVAKVPYQISGNRASTRKPRHWATFDDALRVFNNDPGRYSGVGFVLTGATKSPITFIDIDHCLDAEKKKIIEPWVKSLVELSDTYTEVSPSGTGLRILLHGDTVPFTDSREGLEVYTGASTRFVTITGHRIPSVSKTINKVKPELIEYLDMFRPEVAETSDQEKVSETPAQIRDLVQQLDTEPLFHYDDWLELGLALHHHFDGGPDGEDIWDEVSQKLPNYDNDELSYKYESFGQGGGRHVTLKTIIKKLKTEGKSTVSKVSAAEFPDLSADDVKIDTNPEVSPGWRKTWDDMASIQPKPQIVQDLLVVGEVSFITGDPGTGKSFYALELACAVARGDKFIGNRRTKHGRVVYLTYEGDSSVQQRLRAREAAELSMPSANMLQMGTPPAHLSDPAEFVKMAKVDILPLKPTLLIVDTLAAAIPGWSTSDEEKMSHLMPFLQNLAQTHKVHVCIIHHPPKGGLTTIRGSGLIEGAIDTSIWLSKEGKVITAEVVKQKSVGSYGDRCQFALRPVETGVITEWGAEHSVYVSEDVKAVDGMDGAELDLRELLRTAIRNADGVRLDASGWQDVLDVWGLEYLQGLTDRSAKEKISRYRKRLVDEFTFIRTNRIVGVELRKYKEA